MHANPRDLGFCPKMQIRQALGPPGVHSVTPTRTPSLWSGECAPRPMCTPCFVGLWPATTQAVSTGLGHTRHTVNLPGTRHVGSTLRTSTHSSPLQPKLRAGWSRASHVTSNRTGLGHSAQPRQNPLCPLRLPVNDWHTERVSPKAGGAGRGSPSQSSQSHCEAHLFLGRDVSHLRKRRWRSLFHQQQDI